MSEVELENIRMNPSVEHLAAKYLGLRNTVDVLKSKPGIDQDIIASCETQLNRVDALLKKTFRRKINLIWRLLHHVGEELILVMDEAELAAEGHKILEDLKISSVPDTIKNHWIEILHGRITELEKRLAASAGTDDTQEDNENNDHDPSAESGDAENDSIREKGKKRGGSNSVKAPKTHAPPVNLAATRQLFKTAANTINECMDDRFWDISVRKFFAFIYGSLLLLTGLFLLYRAYDSGQFCLSILNILLIGATGGLASGLISTDQEYLSKGDFWLPTIYYTLIRPTVGAVAAVIVFWMVEGHYLIRVEPPLQDCCVRFSCISSNTGPQSGKKGVCEDTGEIRKQAGQIDVFLPAAAEAADPKSGKVFSHTSSGKTKKLKENPRDAKKHLAANSGAAAAKKDAPLKNDKGGQEESKRDDTSMITLRTVEGRQIYIYLLLLFFAGFSGDKILKSVSCKLNSRMFAEAEKTKDAKK